MGGRTAYNYTLNGDVCAFSGLSRLRSFFARFFSPSRSAASAACSNARSYVLCSL